MRAAWRRRTRLQWTATLDAYTVVVQAGFEAHWRTLLRTSSAESEALLVQADVHWATAFLVGAESPVATVRSTDCSTWTLAWKDRCQRVECTLDLALATVLGRL